MASSIFHIAMPKIAMSDSARASAAAQIKPRTALRMESGETCRFRSVVGSAMVHHI